MIKNFKAFAAASCLGVATLAVTQFAMADQWNKKTILTVNEPIQVPGKVLQPGKYVMKLLDSPSNRHIVQIFNEREDQLQTTVLAIPNYRLQPTGNTEFQWWEVPAGQPRAMRAWFYPGDNFGQEFAYPKTAAVQIAAVNQANVPTTYAETEAELSTARVGTVDRAGTEMELDRQTYSRPSDAQAAAPTQQDNAMVAQSRATPQPADTSAEMSRAQSAEVQRTTPTGADTGAHHRLPDTASPFPLFGLAGFASLGASLAVRALAKRS
ncbi:MAG TPA: hypothetical protein VFL57_04040 [Bryobacteraceae bacterium]|nr:hypothetical protein [Bryobacteraceae bacterium]